MPHIRLINLIVFAVLSLLTAVFSCKEKQTSPIEPKDTLGHVRYAQGFRITAQEGYIYVEVLRPYQGSAESLRYLLVKKGQPVPPHDAKTLVIPVPVQRLVCTSTTHIPLLEYLGASDALVGFPTLRYISSQKMKERIHEGKIMELGADNNMDLEKIAGLKPDLLMGYLVSGDFGTIKKIESLGIPVVINAEYLEGHPLGRAEWIKFMGAFLGKGKEADSVFNEIEKAYTEACASVKNIQERPTVLTGIVYGEGWFLPGGKNYAAHLFRDAGCQYLWDNDSATGYLSLPLETVVSKAQHADLWIGVGTLSSLEELKNVDHRYARFKPFLEKKIYTYAPEKEGGSAFLELGYLRPDLVLKDLVNIAHPGILPQDTLYFYRKLH